MEQGKPEIFFHVGLGKVASTYLQHRVFPKLRGIYYIPTGKYRRSKQIIPSLGSEKILVSREFDRQLEDQVKWFTETYPNAKVIILLRRHDSWIASQYRRHVKNGFQGEFRDFLDLENDQGHWKREELNFSKKLEVIEKYTGQKPKVLFYDDLKADPWTFFDSICDFLGTSYEKSTISLKRVHTSYSEKQLLVLRSFCRRFLEDPPKSYQNKILHWILYRPWWGFFHLILYAATIFPESWVPKEQLINPRELDSVRVHFEEDWNEVLAYAKASELEDSIPL